MDKRAIEQDWYWNEETGDIRHTDTDRWVDFADDDDAGRIAAAAPKMARAVVACLRGEPGWHKQMVEAANKAKLPIYGG